MRTILITILLSFAFRLCPAPGLSDDLLGEIRQKNIGWLERKMYDDEFMRFARHLQSRESPDWRIVNQIGAMGLFQFMPQTLNYLGYGYITPDAFRKDPGIFPPELQVKLLQVLVKTNELVLRDYFCYAGCVINGVTITRSGLLAGAHLGGAMGVILYLKSYGRVNFKDCNGTGIEDYINEFKGYKI